MTPKRVPVAHALDWLPVRRRLGVRSFGVNASTSQRVGDWPAPQDPDLEAIEEEL